MRHPVRPTLRRRTARPGTILRRKKPFQEPRGEVKGFTRVNTLPSIAVTVCCFRDREDPPGTSTSSLQIQSEHSLPTDPSQSGLRLSTRSSTGVPGDSSRLRVPVSLPLFPVRCRRTQIEVVLHPMWIDVLCLDLRLHSATSSSVRRTSGRCPSI